MRIYSQFIKTGDLCFDIGANVGNIAETFLQLGARIVCVEPQEGCIRILTRRFGRRNAVILVRKGLSDSAGEAEMWTCDNNDAIATMSQRWMTAVRDSGRLHFRWTKRQKVSVITLDALVRDYGTPTLCKIDVEGLELRVLRGLSRPLPYISFEFHAELLEDAKACADYIQSLGPCEFNYSTDRSLGLCLGMWLPLEEAFAHLSAAKGPLTWGDIFARSR
jgi:FkbM family methyltransferase